MTVATRKSPSPWAVYARWSGARPADYDAGERLEIVAVVAACLAGNFGAAAPRMIKQRWVGRDGQRVTDATGAKRVYDGLRAEARR